MFTFGNCSLSSWYIFEVTIEDILRECHHKFITSFFICQLYSCKLINLIGHYLIFNISLNSIKEFSKLSFIQQIQFNCNIIILMLYMILKSMNISNKILAKCKFINFSCKYNGIFWYTHQKHVLDENIVNIIHVSTKDQIELAILWHQLDSHKLQFFADRLFI